MAAARVLYLTASRWCQTSCYSMYCSKGYQCVASWFIRLPSASVTAGFGGSSDLGIGWMTDLCAHMQNAHTHTEPNKASTYAHGSSLMHAHVQGYRHTLGCTVRWQVATPAAGRCLLEKQEPWNAPSQRPRHRFTSEKNAALLILYTLTHTVCRLQWMSVHVGCCICNNRSE